jgi:hypothetical protein
MKRAAPLSILLAGLGGVATAQPLGTAFTYQGRLTDAGNPANGAFDLQLALFDAASGGAQVGPALSRDDVVVSSGLFTVSLDFGSVFAGSKRWLEIRVRPGASTGAYTTLVGRQELAPAPNAVFAAGAPWAGVSGKPAGFADDTDNDALGALACPNGQVAKRVGGAWACADDLDSGGDITGVAAGTGLTGGGTSGTVTVSANLAGSGAATTIARSDHNHFAQAWGGSTANGLTVTNAGGGALRGETTASGPDAGVVGTSQSSTGTGVAGTSSATTGASYGVQGNASSQAGAGVYGTNTAADGNGVVGRSTSTASGRGVYGTATSTTGLTRGVVGDCSSTLCTGVLGQALSTTGATVGVWGMNNSSGGFGGYFSNSAGGPALGLGGGGLQFADATVQTTAATGDITAVTAGTGLTGGAASGNATLSVNFGGSGSSNQVARANHDHIGNFWSGPGGLFFENTFPGTPGFWNDTLYATVLGSQSRAILGYATPSSGQNVGVWGQSDSSTGFGVLGYAPATSGVNYGVYGRSDSPTGYAGFFEGLQVAIPNGKLTFAGPGPTRQLIDLRSPAYGIGQQGGVLYFRTEPPGGNFTWFLGGSHSDVQNDPGPGGFRQMRLDGGGNLFVRASFFPGGADFAEMLPAEAGLEPGDVLVIGPDGALTLSTEPYQDSLAGVYSTKPGLVGGAPDGESTEGKIPLAVAGVVPVKVTDEGGPITAGDALTSSSTPGHAMKAAKVRVGGIAFFPSGVVIGKAIEPLHSGTGVIRALVVLQ